VSLLGLRTADFRDRDAFLHALLGMISYGLKLDAALGRLPDRPSYAPGSDQQIDVILGVICLWEKAKSELSYWRETSPVPNTTPQQPHDTATELLR
jgi:hypothetical protein